MPIRRVQGQEADYFLLCFDKDGREKTEHDGTLLSDQLLRVVSSSQKPTDVFVLSHGWLGDVGAAIVQYDRWIATFNSVKDDAVTAGQRDPSFRPLVVCLHWPSLPWGDEVMRDAGVTFLGGTEPDLNREVGLWAERIADTNEAADALAIILGEATKSATDALSMRVRDAYQRLFDESGLGSGDERGRPGADQEGFDLDQIIADSPRFSAPSSMSGPGVLGSSPWRDSRDLVLAPLRTLSFWKMKDRARTFGEGAAHDLLSLLQHAAPGCRFHLMGHSFGCIVVSGAIAGGANGTKLSRPVETLFLAQGAPSLWAFAQDNPYVEGKEGYFRGLIKEALVRGPILATTSRFDAAVGRYYPIGARLARQYVLSAECRQTTRRRHQVPRRWTPSSVSICLNPILHRIPALRLRRHPAVVVAAAAVVHQPRPARRVQLIPVIKMSTLQRVRPRSVTSPPKSRIGIPRSPCNRGTGTR